MYRPTRTRHSLHLAASNTPYRVATPENNPRQLPLDLLGNGPKIKVVYNATNPDDNWMTSDGETYIPVQGNPLDVLIRYNREERDYVYAFVTVPANASGSECEVWTRRGGWRGKAPSAVMVETAPLDDDINPDELLQDVAEIYARPLRYVKNCTPRHDGKRLRNAKEMD